MKYLTLIFLGLLTTAINAQNTRLIYGYDDAGNRILKLTVSGMEEAAVGADSNAELESTRAEESFQEFDTEIVDDFEASIFPNPTSDILNIQLSGDKQANLLLSDANGRVIYTQLLTGGQHELDLRRVQTGVYFLKLEIEGVSKDYKIIRH
jgi:hypothetical protein